MAHVLGKSVANSMKREGADHLRIKLAGHLRKHSIHCQTTCAPESCNHQEGFHICVCDVDRAF